MSGLILVTDGSVNTQTKVGYGACLITSDIQQSLHSLMKDIKLKRFENTSSTKLELQTLLWAFSEIQDPHDKLTVFTDSQNIISLPERRKDLEQRDYCSGKNKPLRNHELYKAFFEITDHLNCDFVKVEGHKPAHQKDQIGKIFALVDKASRRALRQEK